MVRSLYYGPHFSRKLTELSAKGCTTGLVLGSLLGDRAFGVCLVETPLEVTEKTESPEAETKRSTNLDVGWMEEHARQVYRLLPGGLTILGCFIFHPEDVFAKQDGKVRKLVGGVSGLDQSVPDDQLIIVSSNISKSYEPKSSSFKNVEMKPQDKPVEFVRADTSMILDLPVARTKEDELAQDLIPAVQKMEDNLNECIFVIGNKIIPDDQVLGKPFEIDKKKSKGKSKNESLDESEEVVQEIVSVQLLVTDTRCPDSVLSQQSAVRLKVAGKLCSRSYLAPGTTVLEAKQGRRSGGTSSGHSGRGSPCTATPCSRRRGRRRRRGLSTSLPAVCSSVSTLQSLEWPSPTTSTRARGLRTASTTSRSCSDGTYPRTILRTMWR